MRSPQVSSDVGFATPRKRPVPGADWATGRRNGSVLAGPPRIAPEKEAAPRERCGPRPLPPGGMPCEFTRPYPTLERDPRKNHALDRPMTARIFLVRRQTFPIRAEDCRRLLRACPQNSAMANNAAQSWNPGIMAKG